MSSTRTRERNICFRTLTLLICLRTVLLTSNLYSTEHKKQVLANLANFGYDPINYEYFQKLNILDLFLDVLVEETDETMIEFAMGGICNCCLDELNKDFLVANGAIAVVAQRLSCLNEETRLSVITTLMYLTTPETRKGTSILYCTLTLREYKYPSIRNTPSSYQFRE